jgi:retron-type reverse transcriptase
MYSCESRLFELQTELLEERYLPQPYRYFRIKEPKERVISVAAFRDRVVHHALVNIIEPIFESLFVEDSYATRKNKGLHLAVKAAQNYAQSYQWYLKLDIRKYFDSISHEILIKLVSQKIKDPKIITLCKSILKNQTDSMGLAEDTGLPVGNLTSQFFANIYLNTLDYYVKHNLRYKGYVRYMDDFVLFSEDKISLKRDLQLIETFLAEKLKLQIKEKSAQINRTSQGIPFLGYRVYPNLLRVRKENLRRCLKGLEEQERLYLLGEIDGATLYQSTKSRIGFINFADTQRLQKSIWGEGQKAGLTG